MEQQLSKTDDKTVMDILSKIAKSQMRTGEYEKHLSPEISKALQEKFEIKPQKSKNIVTAGDIARDALKILAQEPRYASNISAMINAPAPQSFGIDIGSAAAIITFALIALQTHVRFERDKKGKISVMIERKSATDDLLKPLIEKLLSYLP